VRRASARCTSHEAARRRCSHRKSCRLRYVQRAVSPEEVEIRRRVLGLIQRHGYNSTSFQILEPGFRYWVDGDDACVGYVDTGAAWVVAGAPMPPAQRVAQDAAPRAPAAHAHGRAARSL